MTHIEIRDLDNNVEGILEVKDVGNFQLSLSRTVFNLDTLTKRGGVYSKDFAVPDTALNNKLLEYFFLSSRRNQRGIPYQKNAVIITDGIEVETGIISINTVTSNSIEREYSVNFFSDNMAWVKSLTDLTIKDTGILDFDFTFTEQNVENTWTNEAGDVYVFSVISRGDLAAYQIDDNNYAIDWKKISHEKLFPDLFLRDLLEKIFSMIGYTFESTFFSSSIFNNTILSYSGDEFNHSKEVIDNYSLIASSTSDTHVFVHDVNGELTATPSTNGAYNVKIIDYVSFTNDSVLPNKDPLNSWNGSTFTAQNAGFFDFEIEWTLELETYNSGTNGKPAVDAHTGKENTYVHVVDATQVELYAEVNGTQWIYLDYKENDLLTSLFDVSLVPTATPVLHTFKATEHTFLNVGDVVKFFILIRFEPTSEDVLNPDGTDSGVDVNIVHRIRLNVNNDSSIKIKYQPTLTKGATFNLNEKLDNELKIMSLISDLTSFYNLYWRTNNAIRRVYCEPRDDFFKPISQAVDVTNRIDLQDDFQLVPLSNSWSRKLRFKFASDGNDASWNEKRKNYTNPPDEFIYTFEGDFKEGEKVIQLSELAYSDIFLNTRNIDADNKAAWMVKGWKEDTKNPPWITSLKPRLLHFEQQIQTSELGIDRKILYIDGLEKNPPVALPYTIDFGGVIQYTTDQNYTWGDTSAQNGIVSTYYGKTLKTIEEGYRLTINIRTTAADWKKLDITKPLYIDSPFEIKGYWIVEEIEDWTEVTQMATYKLIQYKQYGALQVIKQGFLDKEVVLTPTNLKPEIGFSTGNFSIDNTVNVTPEQINANIALTPSVPKPPGTGVTTVVLENGSENVSTKGSGNVVIGNNLTAIGVNQMVIGSFNSFEGDASTHIFILGGGTSKENKANAITINKNGIVQFYGGKVWQYSEDENTWHQVVMLDPDNNEVVEIYLNE